MEIRFAQKEDLTSIVKLCKAHATYEKACFDENDKVAAFSKFLFDSRLDLKCLVVESNNEIVGYATFLKQFSTWDAGYYVYLDCLFLKEKARGSGIGYQIMEVVKAYATSENCMAVQWQTPRFNKKAIDFYHKLGAESRSKERFIWKI